MGTVGSAASNRLIAPEAVRRFVKRGRKNDAADAAALCEAARRPEVKSVPVKSVAQQGVLALHTARALLVKQQTMLSNALRSLAAEFGLVVAQGLGRLNELVTLVEVEADVPEAAREAARTLYEQFRAVRDAAARYATPLQGSGRRSLRTPDRMRRHAGSPPSLAWVRSPPP